MNKIYVNNINTTQNIFIIISKSIKTILLCIVIFFKHTQFREIKINSI